MEISQPNRDSALDNQIDRMVLMEGLVAHPVGVTFLQWLCSMCGHNKATMSMEDAARRDIWQLIRQYIPLERLAEIEYEELKERQEQVRQLLEQAGAGKAND